MRWIQLTLVAMFVFSSANLIAQEVAPEKAAPTDQEVLTKAFESLAKEKMAHLKGSITEDAAESGGMAGMVLSMMGGGAPSKKFEGDVSVLITDEGEFLLKSKKKLPGVTIFGSDDRVLTQALWEKKAVDIHQAKNDLTHLLDAGLVARSCKKVKKVKKSLDEETAMTTYKFKLSTKIIPAPAGGGGGMGGMMPNMSKRIMAIRAKVVLSAQGNVVKMSFRVTRSDPMAAIQEMAMGAGGGAIDPSELEDLEEIEGDAAVYSFERALKAPSKKLLATLKTMRELL